MTQKNWSHKLFSLLLDSALLAVCFFLAIRYYLLFHLILEGAIIFIAVGISVITWSAGDKVDSQFLRFVGNTILFTAVLEIFHLATYQGMGIFEGLAGDTYIQFWAAARWMEVVIFYMAVLLRKRRIPSAGSVIIFAAITGFLVYLIMGTDVYPVCLVEGAGLSPFLRISGYILTILFFILTGYFLLNKKVFVSDIRFLIGSSLLYAGLAEFIFNFYVEAHSISSYLGHMCKAASYFMLFRAIIRKGIREPQNLLYRGLIQKEDALEKALAEKELLMREIHHRVKNSLTLVASFVELETLDITDPIMKTKLTSLRERITSISLIHDRLSSSGEVNSVDFAVYIRELMENLMASGMRNRNQVGYEIRIPSMILPVDKALPLGIIVNELVTNSLKYAFPDERRGGVRIEISHEEASMVLIVADNGVGMAETEDRESTSLGKMIVASLIDQLGGKMAVDTTLAPAEGSGTRYILEFPC